MVRQFDVAGFRGIQGLCREYRDNGKENGNYYLGSRALM